jgi:hypothetical protein
MRVITYNAGNASAARVTTDYANLAARDPDVIGSQEVTDRAHIIAHVPGMTGIQLHSHPNSAHVALNIRDGLPFSDVQLKKLNNLTWVGRLVAGARKSGKSKIKYILSALVGGRRVGVTHLVPSWTRKRCILARRLARKQVAGCVEWFNAGGDVLMMDGNGPANHPVFAPLRKVAVPYAKGKSHGIERDIIWVRKGAATHVDVRALSGYSSDHKPVVADITWAAKPAPKPPHKEKPVKFAAPAPTYLGPAAHTSAGRNKPITRIVIHSTVSACKPGGAQAIARYFRGQSAGGSAHYVVDPAGSVQVVWDDVIAWHAPPNAHSLGVELCDTPGTDSAHKASVKRWDDKNHTAMLDHAAELVAGLCLAYDVPIRKIGPGQLKAGQHGICGHVDVSEAWHQSTHWDPGNFPWPRFIAMVKAKADAMKSNAAPKPEAKPKPKPAPTPAPAPKPKLEQDTIDGARTISKRAAKHGNKHRASKWRSIWRAMLGRKSS